MCGICAVIPKDPQDRRWLEPFLEAWEGHEARGKDAAGFYLISGKDLVVGKSPGPARNLTGYFSDEVINGVAVPFAVAHTRQATAGTPNQNVNNHPFETPRLVGVHNGVFGDHKLWEPLPGLRGECDSEVLFRVLDYITPPGGSYAKFLETLHVFNRLVFFDITQWVLYAYSTDPFGLCVAEDSDTGDVWVLSDERLAGWSIGDLDWRGLRHGILHRLWSQDRGFNRDILRGPNIPLNLGFYSNTSIKGWPF